MLFKVPSLPRRGFRGGLIWPLLNKELKTGKIYNRKIDNEKRKSLRNNMTKAEEILWGEIKNRKILGFKFRRQFGIGAYVVDFYCTELKFVIEIDGATHLTDEEIEYDRNRENEIKQLDIRFIRFTNIEIYEALEYVLERLKAKIQELAVK
ncbi:MAG: endonuclease domain-containing protein [Ignavibacteria bacterium]